MLVSVKPLDGFNEMSGQKHALILTVNQHQHKITEPEEHQSCNISAVSLPTFIFVSWFLYLLNLQPGSKTVCLFVLARADLKVNLTWGRDLSSHTGASHLELVDVELWWGWSVLLSMRRGSDTCSICYNKNETYLWSSTCDRLSCVFCLWKWTFSLRQNGNELLTSFVIESIKWATERK